MEVKRCSRCGVFYTNQGPVCSKCTNKDTIELNQFKTFVEKNGVETNSLSQIAQETGISERNLNRFLDYDELQGYKKFFIS